MPRTDPEQGNKRVGRGRRRLPAGGAAGVWRIGRPRDGDGARRGHQGVRRARASAAVRDVRRRGVRARGASPAWRSDFVQYISTPEEYGAAELRGRVDAVRARTRATFLVERYVELAHGAGRRRSRARAPFELDASYGVAARRRPRTRPARESGRSSAQPGDVARLRARDDARRRARRRGGDLPNGPGVRHRAAARRRASGAATRTTSGCSSCGASDEDGRYSVQWEVPLSAPVGDYRFACHRASLPALFDGVPRQADYDTEGGASSTAAFGCATRRAEVNVDLTARPAAATGGVVRTAAGAIRQRRGTVFAVPARRRGHLRRGPLRQHRLAT